MTLIRFADPEAGGVDDIVDLERYPIHQPGSERCGEVVHQARAQLDNDGCTSLPGFIRAGALSVSRSEIAALAAKAVMRRTEATVYARTDAHDTLPEGDPRRLSFRRLVGYLTRDQIPPDTTIARIYAAPAFKSFVAACTGTDRVFEYADPLAGLICTIVPPDGEVSWHYDTNEYVVSLMTQAPDSGGAFEYCPDLRASGRENIDGLGRVLRGEADELIRAKQLRAGDVQIFAGRYSLHRVTRVEGELQRHVAVLSYGDRPGVIGPVDRTRAVYGRVTEAHLVAEEFDQTGPDGLIL